MGAYADLTAQGTPTRQASVLTGISRATASRRQPCASGWGETPALLTFALHGARSDHY